MNSKIGTLIALTFFCFSFNGCASLSYRAQMKTGMAGGCISGAALGAGDGKCHQSDARWHARHRGGNIP